MLCMKYCAFVTEILHTRADNSSSGYLCQCNGGILHFTLRKPFVFFNNYRNFFHLLYQKWVQRIYFTCSAPCLNKLKRENHLKGYREKKRRLTPTIFRNSGYFDAKVMYTPKYSIW